MFFNYLKDFYLKKKLKNSLLKSGAFTVQQKVQTIGILVDEVFFAETSALINALIEKGFHGDKIAILAFNNSKDLKSVRQYPVFGWNSVSFDMKIQEQCVNEFIENPFDVLLSYYETSNGLLEWITYQSKARFKVGFYAANQRLNDLMINTNANNHNQFVQEFVRVLKQININ